MSTKQELEAMIKALKQKIREYEEALKTYASKTLSTPDKLSFTLEKDGVDFYLVEVLFDEHGNSSIKSRTKLGNSLSTAEYKAKEYLITKITRKL